MRRCRSVGHRSRRCHPPGPSVSLERFRYRNVNVKFDKMDSNFNSCDMYLLKTEIDSDNEQDCLIREPRLNWNSDNTMKLIDTLEKECRELWDMKHPMNKDRAARQIKLEYLANMFGTTAEEISRKIHNLRTQFNNEVRKIKRRQTVGESNVGAGGGSGWEYFEALSFLTRAPPDPLETVDSVNIELAEFQANEEEVFGAAARARAALANSSSPALGGTEGTGRKKRVAASAPLPMPVSALMWPEEPLPMLRADAAPDECQIFGDFVASELRSLRSQEVRRRLKRIIQKAILKVGEEEDNKMSS